MAVTINQDAEVAADIICVGDKAGAVSDSDSDTTADDRPIVANGRALLCLHPVCVPAVDRPRAGDADVPTALQPNSCAPPVIVPLLTTLPSDACR